jgi:hypothetical protein
MDTRKGKDKQINNEHKKREGQTDKQWTQERGRTNRQTMNTRNGKDKQTNNGHKKREGQVSIVCLFVLPVSCVDC